MVNERVDARSGRPQLAATQSFVYRGAVCATTRNGWALKPHFLSSLILRSVRYDRRRTIDFRIYGLRK